MILRTVQYHLAQWFPKCDPRVPKDPQPPPRGSVGASVMATLNLTDSLIKEIMICKKNNRGTYLICDIFISHDS
jgi:hypothetical protein